MIIEGISRWEMRLGSKLVPVLVMVLGRRLVRMWCEC